jgi:hypothetical protein
MENVANRMNPQKHNHGRVFRAKIVTINSGGTEYGEWFNTEVDLRSSMDSIGRHLGKRYYCEASMVPCAQAECNVDQTPKVIAVL